ncbi:MAG TPA: lysophospholipid acyltransferase family protein [Bacillus sp. (in: firmicutes)]|uniref:lysophospholipid acyltransferase family protein n=1 Tax=Bacillus litorisediminis TaxID=2922713 RepID=UPI001FACF179|nr:lysophospholipid acyltransferase family protein [Bacillus litorisediminis]HWO75848.1 lysophospholipid acyltransferase family protein [Bacillus sp. (in: firmicutes)]
MSFYHFAKTAVSVLLFPAYRIQVIGKENIPKEGGVLLCSNHISNLDPPVVGITCPRPISFMAKAELFDAPIFGTILKKVHAFPVKRGMSDREALRTGLKALKDGHVLGLFPEGTRSKTGELGKGLAGAGFFAMRTDAKVVPCAIIGEYKFFRKIKVVYGKPIDFDEMRENKASAEEATDHIMSAIKALIDTHNQGSKA